MSCYFSFFSRIKVTLPHSLRIHRELKWFVFHCGPPHRLGFKTFYRTPHKVLRGAGCGGKRARIENVKRWKWATYRDEYWCGACLEITLLSLHQTRKKQYWPPFYLLLLTHSKRKHQEKRNGEISKTYLRYCQFSVLLKIQQLLIGLNH